MKNSKYYNKIVRNRLFKGADEHALLSCLDSHDCNVQHFEAGEAINMSGRLAFVINGTVHVCSRDMQRNLFLRKIEKNEIFGVAGLFLDKTEISRCFAKGSVTILFFGSECIKTLIEKDKTVMYNYLSFLSDRIDYLNGKITYITAGTAERKLAVYLCSFGTDFVYLPVSFSALADMLDIGRASLYRALDRFAADGCIERNGSNVKITNKFLMLEKY